MTIRKKNAVTYEKFIQDDFHFIQQEFYDFGFDVIHPDEIDTYDGWMIRGRRVKRGEKGLKLDTPNAYSQPLYQNGSPQIDEKGNRKFAKWSKRFCLFHFYQTEKLKVKEFA